ncbi:MAG: hypothetical protein AAGB46_13850, partial [Verrucomicrobiota bacterium]
MPSPNPQANPKVAPFFGERSELKGRISESTSPRSLQLELSLFPNISVHLFISGSKLSEPIIPKPK